ncbi:hypothetical protein E2C01_025066 [Portunus trituberculatus]|uniref:Uncharacterized protein n=1 Tax=Portunus trituberculatus TaxID=210409 RepID=A0A5B7EEP9_PORTR|nr:hypothetical protein [Portunus trituberculatus]
MEDGDRRTRGHSKIIKSQCLRKIKKFSFPHRTVDIWNGLSEEIVTAESVHKFKEKFDKYRYGDQSLGAPFEPYNIKLNNTHTHTHTFEYD